MLDAAAFRDLEPDRIVGDPTPPALLSVTTLAARLADVTLAIVTVDGEPEPTPCLADPLVAAERGYRHFSAQPVVAPDGTPLATLCLLDHEHHELTDEQRETLAGVAAVAADHIELVRRERKAQSTAAQLQEGLLSNRTIGKAMGLIMAQYRIDEDAAFVKIRDHSRDLNMKVRVLAEQIVTHHNRGCAPSD